MLDTTSTTFLSSRKLSGLFLSKNKLSPKARARLAADILEQRAVITRFTVQQIASLCRVSISSVNAARSSRSRRPAITPELDKAIAKIRATRGLAVRVAKACGIKRAAVYQWTRVPIERVHAVSELIGMPPEEIRPDIFRPTWKSQQRQGHALRVVA